MRTLSKMLATLNFSLLATLIISLASISQAEVYKHVDEQGKASFSDKPDPKAVKIQLPEPNTAQAVAPRPSKPESPAIVVTETYQSVAITQPKNQDIIPNGLFAVTVNSQVSPALQAHHQLQLSIDGNIHSTGRSSFTIDSMTRGEHQLQLAVIDDTGKVLKQSPPVKLFVYRPH